MNPHLSQDELLDQMYGVGAKEAHLRECGECSGRMQALLATKARLRAETPALQSNADATVSDEFLAAQRRSIYARLDRDAAMHVRWVPALAFAGLLAMGLILYRPHAQYGPAHSTDTTARVELNARAEVNEAVNVGVNNDAQLVSDLYSMEDSVEPLAAAPIHGLFEETAGAAQQ